MTKDQLPNVPQLPGVYLFKNKNGTPIYVGKASNLKSRVSSYFALDSGLGTKTSAMLSKAAKLDFIIVDSEIASLLLEIDLIKRYKPKYNIALKDDKRYSLIEFYKENRNGIRIVRKQGSKSSYYFGPFPNGGAAKEVLKILRRAYPYADCSNNKFARYQKILKPCLYGKIGLCSAPCVSNDFKTNNRSTHSIKRIFKTGGSNLTKKMEADMKLASRERRYEDAAKIRDLLSRIKYLSQSFTHPAKYITNPDLEADIRSKELTELKLVLNLPKIPNRVEFYDISNISGKYATGSMVVIINGNPEKGLYRRFKIKTKQTADDFAMIAEVIKRRFSHLDWGYPDLVVVDGGLGQVSAAARSLKDFPYFPDLPNLPVIGLSKKQETIVLPNGKEIHLPKSSPALLLLMRGRDESHRFAKAYFKKLLLKSIMPL